MQTGGTGPGAAGGTGPGKSRRGSKRQFAVDPIEEPAQTIDLDPKLANGGAGKGKPVGGGSANSSGNPSGDSKLSFQDAAKNAGVDMRSGTDAGAGGGGGVATGGAVSIGPSFRNAAKDVGVEIG